MVRYKYRYIVSEIEVKDRPEHAPLTISKHNLQSKIIDKIHEIHGDYGEAAVRNGFRLKYCNPYTKIVIIRSSHGPHFFVRTVLPLIKKVDGVNLRFNILYLGGTLIKCFKFIRNHQLATLERYWNLMKSDEDRAQMKQSLFKLNLGI